MKSEDWIASSLETKITKTTVSTIGVILQSSLQRICHRFNKNGIKCWLSLIENIFKN